MAGAGLLLLTAAVLQAQGPPESTDRAAWERLQRLPLSESTFRAACDMLQATGKNNPALGYELLARYVARVRTSGNRPWLHVLLMGWARAKSSMILSNEADSLYRLARQNAGPGTRAYREALVGTVLLYGEWNKTDSLEKYLVLGERECRRAGDRENLSFLYTFRAVSHPRDTAAMRRLLGEAARLAAPLPDKNALFTARYNYANVYLQNDPQRQVAEFESLAELAAHPSLNRYPRRLYERTAFTFRNAKASVYYQLMQLNLLLTDYDNAGRFAELFYDTTVRPAPNGVQAAFFNAEMAIVKAYQGQWNAARAFLARSRAVFGVPEAQIEYIGYFIAAGLLAEHAGQLRRALYFFEKCQSMGNGLGLYLLPPAVYYAHALTRNGNLAEAERVLTQYQAQFATRPYSSNGLYFQQYLAELLRAKGDYPAYARALETYYAIKDSLTNLNQYRAIQQVLARVQLREREVQITRMRAEEIARTERVRRERRFYFAMFGLAGAVILLLALLLRNRQVRSRQREALHRGEVERLEKQRRIERMQGAMEAEQHERRKIADQLHDEVAGMLALATLNVSSALETGLTGEQAETKLRKTEDALAAVSATVREISHRLTPVALERYGFRRAIEDLAETVNAAGKLRVRAVVVGFDEPKKLPADFLDDLYRITQELLHNVLKHAHATEATVQLVEHDDAVSLLVEDNGVGMTGDTPDGQGLRTIRSRVAYRSGHLEISRRPEGGTMVVVEVPTAVLVWNGENAQFSMLNSQ
jgi:signal transduction histidine kinase